MEPGGIGSDVLGRAKPEQGEPSVEQRRVASEVRSVLFGENERMRIGRFVVEEPLGQGGMGVVYAAHDPDLDRRVAVKLLSRADADGFEARLRLEAQAMARLSHPNVAVVHEVGSHEGRVFVAMELVDGVTLRAWADDHARSWREILDVYLQAGDGLVAAHEAGLVHRDFKPDNAMLGTDGRVRVLDFGLASSRRHEEGIDDRDTRIARDRLTETGTLLGTPAYMAPEQIDGGGVDTRSDQFAFCVALFEALYGVRPYSGRTVGELGEAIGAGHIAAPKRSVGPAWLRRVLQRGLRAAPEERWSSTAELLSRLRGGLRRRTRRGALAVGLVAVAATVALVGREDSSGSASAPVAQEECPSGDARLAGVWDDDTKRRLRLRFAESTDSPSVAAAVFAAVEAEVDVIARDWRATYAGVCGRDDDARARLRQLDCLERSRAELERYAAGLSRLPVSSLVMTPFDITQISDPAECGRREIVRAAPDPPAAEEADEVAAVREALLQSYAKPATTAAELAAIYEPLVTRAGALSYPVAADVLLSYAERGWLYSISVPEVSAVLARAIDSATRSRSDAVLARAQLLRVEISATQGATDEMARELDASEVSISRSGEPRHLRVALQRMRALVAAIDGEYDRARGHLDAAERLVGERYGESNLRLASLLAQRIKDVSEPTCDLAEARGGVDRIESLLVRHGIEGHPGGALQRAGLARIEWLCGQRPQAERTWAKAEAVLGRTPSEVVQAHPSIADDILTNLALSRIALHRCPDALALIDASLEELPPPAHATLHALGVLAASQCLDPTLGEHASRGLVLLKEGAAVVPAWQLALWGGAAVAAAESGRAADVDAALAGLREAARPLAGLRASALAWESLAEAARGDHARALQLARESMPRGEWAGVLGRAGTRQIRVHFAEAAVHAGQPGEALVELERVLPKLERCCEDAPLRAWARFVQAQALVALDGDAGPAVALAREALEGLDHESLAPRRAAVEAWLRARPSRREQ